MNSPNKPVSGISEISLFRNFSSVALLLVLFVLLVSGFFLIHRQKAILRQEQIKAGEFLLNYVVRSAPIPLLEEDNLSLNTTVKQAMIMDCILYVTIVDSAGIIRAHTDLKRIGTAFNDFESKGTTPNNENITYVTYTLPSDETIINLSKPISFMNRKIGAAHLGLSADYIDSMLREKTISSVQKISYFGIFMIVIVLGTSLFLSKRSYRQISESTSSLQQKPPELLLSQIRRNQITVLYAGMKGFKEYANDRSPEDVFKGLNEYYAIASHLILDFGGFVDKFVGDAVIGVFGDSPFASDHTQRAVGSAVAIQEALRTSGENGNPLSCKVGIGISSGVALCGLIGSPIKKEYTFIGESFETAYSLYLMAGPGEIVIGKEVYQSIETSASVEPVPPLEMTKKTESWKNFRLKTIVPRKS
jgi:adenylate cyclase